MRAYFFTNMYLSSIQNGIQPQHCTAELFMKYGINCGVPGSRELRDWARDHKTTIVLNGGYSSTLRELAERFDNSENPYPWATFNESEEALDGALTCVGIVLPEKIYVTSQALTYHYDNPDVPHRVANLWKDGYWTPDVDHETWEISKWEFDLCVELRKYDLAT